MEPAQYQEKKKYFGKISFRSGKAVFYGGKRVQIFINDKKGKK